MIMNWVQKNFIERNWFVWNWKVLNSSIYFPDPSRTNLPSQKSWRPHLEFRPGRAVDSAHIFRLHQWLPLQVGRLHPHLPSPSIERLWKICFETSRLEPVPERIVEASSLEPVSERFVSWGGGGSFLGCDLHSTLVAGRPLGRAHLQAGQERGRQQICQTG